MTIDFRKLESFVAVAEELHFGRAAERVGIAQPPLSRRIKEMEEELGVLLFNRGRSSISLTQAGENFYAHALDILQHLESAELEARRIGQGAEGVLRLGFVGSATYGILPNILKSFRMHYSNISLILRPMNNAALRRALIRREIDVAVARPKLDDPDFVSKQLSKETLSVAVPDSWDLARQGQATLNQIEHLPVILYPERPRPSFADDILKLCENAGFQPSNRLFTMDLQTAISLVSVAVGVCVVPTSVGDASRKGIRFVKLTDKNAETALSITYRIDDQSVHTKRFVDLAMKVSRVSI